MPTRDEDREARLAAALRENLRRRKAQARGVAGDGGGERELSQKIDPAHELE